MFGTEIIVHTAQRGIHYQDGKPVAIVGPGRYRVTHSGTRGRMDVFGVGKPLHGTDMLRALEEALPKAFDKHLQMVSAGQGETVLVRAGKDLVGIVQPGATEAYWKEQRDITTATIDVSDAPPIARKDVRELSALGHGNGAMFVTVPTGFEGIVYVDGATRETLKAGVYGFWDGVRDVAIQIADMRQQSTEVTAQEILTKDRVSVRVTLTAFWKVSDLHKALGAKDRETQLYRYIQFAIRDTVAKRTLDELLDARATLDKEVTDAVRAMDALPELGLGVEMVGVKDIILPGDMREILNRVVEAEKQSQANLIRRKEETAATRSLLNTARLMENNPLLLRMKELETLEKLTEKVGHLNVNTSATGNGLDALLNNLVTLGTGPKDKDD